MPRTARLQAPFAVHHIISRIVNGEFRIRTDGERAEYLRRLGQAVRRCDWSVLGYAVMSNHVHLVCRSGMSPAERLIRSVHSGFAGWLNRAQERLGPVFAERFSARLVPDDALAIVLAYVHNNPVRAEVVREPTESTWTSHRAFLGLESAPRWLALHDALETCGFGATARGRMAFHALTLAHRADQRDDVLAGDASAALRESRQFAGAPVEVTDGIIEADVAQRRHEVVATKVMPLRPRWPGDVLVVIGGAAELLDVPVHRVRSNCRDRPTVAARRLALLVWTGALGRSQREMAEALGLSASGACQLLNRNDDALAKLARRAEWLAAKCWALSGHRVVVTASP